MRRLLFYNNRLQILLSIIIICLSSIPIIYFISTHRPLYGIIVIAGIIGIATIMVCLLKPESGFLLMFLYCSFMAIIARIIGNLDFSYGIVRDLMIYVVFFGIIIQRYFNRYNKWISNTPIFLSFLVFTSYLLIEFFNPESSMKGWLFGMKGYISYILVYLILMHILKDYYSVVKFTKLWLIIFFLAAIYACYQEWFGLPSYDLRWVTANPTRIGLNWTQGRWDKWSFVSDIAVFGLMMSFSSLFVFILSIGPYSRKKRIVFFISGALMFIAMIFSGNRTAFASFPFGMIFFGILTLNNPRTLWVSILFGILIIVMVFGPFYGGKYVARLRSAFSLDDQTLVLRDNNRAFIQPYIHAHPIGGGWMTSGENGNRYAPNHELAGFPPDSLYLEAALELGWIGLFVRIAFYFVIMIQGISGYFSSKNKKIKILYLAYSCSFFSLTIAAFAKKALTQIPLGFVLMGVYVILDRLIDYDYENKEIR